MFILLDFFYLSSSFYLSPASSLSLILTCFPRTFEVIIFAHLIALAFFPFTHFLFPCDIQYHFHTHQIFSLLPTSIIIFRLLPNSLNFLLSPSFFNKMLVSFSPLLLLAFLSLFNTRPHRAEEGRCFRHLRSLLVILRGCVPCFTLILVGHRVLAW